jgi:hypothetical protein
MDKDHHKVEDSLNKEAEDHQKDKVDHHQLCMVDLEQVSRDHKFAQDLRVELPENNMKLIPQKVVLME